MFSDIDEGSLFDDHQAVLRFPPPPHHLLFTPSGRPEVGRMRSFLSLEERKSG